MRIRTLDQDVSSNQLEVVRGGDGDVYFTIYQNSANSEGMERHCGESVSVRVGMAGSGMHLPGNMSRIIGELADEFDKYKDCTFESDACDKDRKETKEEFKNITRLYDDLNQHTNQWSVLLFRMKYASSPYMLVKTRTGAWFTYELEAWKMESFEDLSIDEALKSAIDNIIEGKHDGRAWRNTLAT